MTNFRNHYKTVMKYLINTAFTFTMMLSGILMVGCEKQNDYPASDPIFPKGQPSSPSSFTGNAWHTPLVTNDSIYNTVTGSVLFEAGARTNWHSHPGGQILIVLSGVGYHQVKGQSVEIIRKGDVIKCPPNAVHWHGASKDSDMSHLYILPNTEKGIVKWMEPVTDLEYSEATNK
jgi:quercetin dioxygenase-like cupin family protein